ncbi:ubiquitin-like modifier-activating enzyme 5 isoform X2 [Temnothorax nylanderi]|uniref:ubiquitin-like modifier-activating enzyme 5 isoform X2 n=1 Tax=Temnothorax nylanderi TaxID=102681 RepID=UPI003A86BEF8
MPCSHMRMLSGRTRMQQITITQKNASIKPKFNEIVCSTFVVSSIDEKTLKRKGVCAASLPTTMGYNAMEDFFPTMTLKPNPNCDDAHCKQRQKEYLAIPKIQQKQTIVIEQKPVHEDNEWGISLLDERSGHSDEKTCVSSTPGVRHAYTVSTPTYGNNSEEEQTVPESTGLSLEELMAEMKSI